jgi:hypothetical protein
MQHLNETDTSMEVTINMNGCDAGLLYVDPGLDSWQG